MQGQCAVQTGILTSLHNLMYRIIQNSLTHFTKLVHLNGEEESNTAHCDKADVKLISHFCPYLLQHVTTDF